MDNFEYSEQSATTQMSEAKNNTEKDLIFYGSKDVAKMLSCSIPKAQEIMHRQDFPLIQVGKKMLVFKDAFVKWAMEKRTEKQIRGIR